MEIQGAAAFSSGILRYDVGADGTVELGLSGRAVGVVYGELLNLVREIEQTDSHRYEGDSDDEEGR